MQQSVEHKHDIIYYGVVNLIHDSVVMGAIDVWRCRGCSEIFCEDKRYGVQDLAAEVGFPKIEPGAKWAALVCIREKGSDWTLTGVKPGTVIHHSCTPDTKVDLTVGAEYSIEQGMSSGIGRHRIIVLGDFVNDAVDVETGRKHTGPTNANQAPGRPFSFPAEKSAVPVSGSRYNAVNLSALTLLIIGISSALLALSASLTTLPGSLLLVTALLGIAASYFTLGKKPIGPLLGLAEAAAGIASISVFNLSSASLAMLILFTMCGVLAWISYSRIKRLSRQRWHPLDMPAYG